MLKNRSTFGIILAIMVVLISFSPQIKSFYTIPTTLKLGVGDSYTFNLKLPTLLSKNMPLEFVPHTTDVVTVFQDSNDFHNSKFIAKMNKIGETSIKLKLFGLIPLKNIEVNVVPRLKLVPGGHSIGILLKSEGITVIGFSQIKNENNQTFSPAEEAGVKIGDIIETIENIQVFSDQEISSLVDNFAKRNKEINLGIKRGNLKFNLKIKPKYCNETKRYRIGLYIRDATAGVGTLTFFDPITQSYGALGHVIADAEVNKQLMYGEGKIVDAQINGIQQAFKGQPGEKIGSFIGNKHIFGDIQKNTNYGIFGSLYKEIKNEHFKEPLPVAFGEEVKPGSASILTVINGNKIEEFEIEIIKVNNSISSKGRNLFINITDPRLLQLTGGIIQGMSGSPIIQDGYLIGAVTHVLVNDPAKGYGIFIENMLQETTLKNELNRAA